LLLVQYWNDESYDPNGDYENNVIDREFNLNVDGKKFWLGRIESMDDEIMNESMLLLLNYLTRIKI